MSIEIKEIGLNIQMAGFILSDRNTIYHIAFPNEANFENDKSVVVINPSEEAYEKIVRQMDLQELELIDSNTNKKVVVRKSQRNLDQGIIWKVFARDKFTCRYCGIQGVPMTYDHIKLWEDQGDITEENGVCACRKCNKTRGNMDYKDWMNSGYYFDRSRSLSKEVLQANTLLITKYKSFPDKISKRKR